MTTLAKSIESFSANYCTTLARFSIYLALASLMFCVPLMNKCYYLAAILFFISGHWRQVWPVLLKDKIVIVAVLLVSFYFIGMVYSEASWHMAFRATIKYLKLLFLLFFIPLFNNKNSRNTAFFIFILGVMVNEIFTYLHFFNVFNFGFGPGKHWLFVQDIDAGFIVSFAAFLLANYCFDNRRFRLIALFCFLILSFDILFLNQERTGYLIYLVLAGLFLWQRMKWRGLISAMIAIPLLFGSLYLTSHKFHDRVNQVVTNISDYQHGKEVTSIGLRLVFAQFSFNVIKHHWLIGTGTGSFQEMYKKANGPKLDDGTWPSHPHNEYIATTYHLGIIGLFVLIYWFYLQIKASFTLPKEMRYLFQGLIVGFILLGFCNASLLVNPASGFFIVLLSLFLAIKIPVPPQRESD
jgi:O-antigen ligase